MIYNLPIYDLISKKPNNYNTNDDNSNNNIIT